MAEENQLEQNLSLDQIVFQRRNKAYGAYDLRTSYSGVLTRAMLIGTAIFTLGAVSPLILAKINEEEKVEEVKVKAKIINIEEQPPLEEKKPEPPPPPPPKQEEPPKQEIIRNVVPEPKKDPPKESPPPPVAIQKTTTTGLITQEGEKKPQAPAPPPPAPPAPSGTGAKPAPPAPPSNAIVDNVDENAAYPGGMNALRAFLGDNFDQSAVDSDGGKLTATLRFVVERDGTVSDVQVISKSGNADFDAEATRTVKKLRKWTPGKKDGQSVRSRFTVPFTMVFE